LEKESALGGLSAPNQSRIRARQQPAQNFRSAAVLSSRRPTGPRTGRVRRI